MSRSARLGLFLWGSIVVGSGASGAACSSASPMDMWITKDPDAGSDFKMPVREAGVGQLDAGDDTGGPGGATGAGGDTSGGGGASGAGGDTSGVGGGVGGSGGSGGGSGAGGSGGSAGTGP